MTLTAWGLVIFHFSDSHHASPALFTVKTDADALVRAVKLEYHPFALVPGDFRHVGARNQTFEVCGARVRIRRIGIRMHDFFRACKGILFLTLPKNREIMLAFSCLLCVGYQNMLCTDIWVDCFCLSRKLRI